MTNKLIIPKNHKIALLYEGSAEKAIIENLLDNNQLIFNRDDLLEGKIFKRCGLLSFCKSHLGHEMSNTIYIIRIIDSKGEKYNIPPVYEHKIEEVLTIITSPEIEILHIISEGKYDDYQNNHKKLKPSKYANEYLHLKKSFSYHENFWKTSDLISSIKEYDRVTSSEGYNLSDLLKKEN